MSMKVFLAFCVKCGKNAFITWPVWFLFVLQGRCNGRNVEKTMEIGVSPSKRGYKTQNDQVERALGAQDKMVELLSKIHDQNNRILDEMKMIRETMNKFKM